MKKRKLFIFTCVLGIFSLLSYKTLSAEIIQKYSPAEINFLDFVMVDSSQNGDILTRTFKLKVKNISQDSLYNVKAALINASDQVVIDKGAVNLGIMNPGNEILSSDDFIYSIDTLKVKVIPEIKLHWEIEYENGDGNIETYEALIIEKL